MKNTLKKHKTDKLAELNTDLINQLALDYAQNGGKETIANLFYEMKPLIDNEATIETRKAHSYGVMIPFEDFESAFSMCLWTAVEGYNGKTDFVQRFYFFLRKRYRPDVWRQYQTTGSKEDKDGRRYDKARNDSLDREIAEDLTLGESICDEVDIEDEITERQAVIKLMNEFQKINERYHKVITLIYQGCTNDEIAKALGETSYNDKIRKLVSRSKRTFKQYLSKNLFA